MSAYRPATLRLRGGVLAELTWPPGPPRAVLVFIGATHRPVICGALSASLNALTLSVVPATRDDAGTLLEWTADHAQQLVDEPEQLMIAGLHGGAGLAAALALRGGEDRWPAIAGQILIHPTFEPQDERQRPSAGVAPAMIATRDAPGRRYAERLRRTGVRVCVLEHPDPFTDAVALPGAATLLAELADASRSIAPQRAPHSRRSARGPAHRPAPAGAQAR